MSTPTITPREKERLIGKDELNLADWRISVPTHQQPRKEDGGKLDVIEHELPTAGGATQKVTLMAPSVVGLPTPVDEDLLIALLYLAKEQRFASDTVHFSTSQLCRVMHKSLNESLGDRIEQGLTRLKALTIKYELAWYDKLKAEVEPILITGILAEAKLMRRRGRIRKDEPHDSYVQWTKNFYTTIQAGNLTDIDLDLYFALSRPGAKQLYRHLNKRFHGRREQQRYERDLAHLACGHLGMKKSKYLKRNLDQCIRELEDHGYIVAEDEDRRYRKVRPGVWRVGFELAPAYRKTGPRRGVPSSDPPSAGDASRANALVREFHAQWTGRGECDPSGKEIAIAESLITEHGYDTISGALPRLLKVLKDKWPDCRTFKGVEVYLSEALAPVRERERREEERQREQEERDAERRRTEAARNRDADLEAHWQQLSAEEQQEIQAAALTGHPPDLMQRRPTLAHVLCLVEFGQRREQP